MKRVKIKSLEQLHKEREKHRQKIIKEFGNPIVKLFSDQDLRNLRELLGELQTNYIEGAGSCWWSVKSTYMPKRENFIKYLLTIDFVREVTIRDNTEEEMEGKDNKDFTDLITFKFKRPEHETEFRD